MKCPVCTEVDLTIADRQGIEIDFCPKCRGVWLDRGELDKLIERSLQQPGQQPPQGYAAPQPPQYGQPAPYGRQPPPPPPQRAWRDDDDDDDDRDKHYRRKRRGGLLGEIFDFD